MALCNVTEEVLRLPCRDRVSAVRELIALAASQASAVDEPIIVDVTSVRGDSLAWRMRSEILELKDPDDAYRYALHRQEIPWVLATIPRKTVLRLRRTLLSHFLEWALVSREVDLCDVGPDGCNLDRTERDLGLSPAGGLLQFLARRVGPAAALNSFLSGSMACLPAAHGRPPRVGDLHALISLRVRITSSLARMFGARQLLADLGEPLQSKVREVTEEGFHHSLDEALDLDAQAFAYLFATRESRALRQTVMATAS